MAKDIKTHRFSVNGHGAFPIDMLRYDRCWPTQERQAPALTTDSRAPARTIYLEGLRPPTTARWASFGWEAK